MTFERVWKLRSKYRRNQSAPTTWIFGIARNVLKEHFRKNKKFNQRFEQIPDSNELSSRTNIEQDIQQKQDKKLLHQMLLDLPARNHELIAYKYGAGLTNREIAEVTGLSETNVGTILYRIVKKLRKRWEIAHG